MNPNRVLLVTRGSRSYDDLRTLLAQVSPDVEIRALELGDASDRAAVEAYALVVLDGRVEADGVELAPQAARLLSALSGVPSVAVVADERSAFADELIGCGADECSVPSEAAFRAAVVRARIRKAAALANGSSHGDSQNHARARRLKHHNEALRALAKQLASDDLPMHLRAITEAAADSMEVARAGVWLLDPERRELRAADVLDKRGHVHSEGQLLTARDYPAYFRALEDKRVIAAEDAQDHPLTRAFAQHYLAPLGIVSMLDAPIRVGTRVLGVLCLEHVGEKRRFSDEDESVAGSFADFVALAIESHEHKRAEQALRTSNAQLEEARRIEAVGRLAGGVAHDFNNVITVVSSYAFLLAKKLDKNDPLQAPVAEIGKAAERAADITRKLLALSRRDPASPRVFDLNAVVRGMETFLRRLIGEHIALKLELSSEPLLLKADPVQTEQIILNLIVNARDAARPQGSSVVIRTALDGGNKKKTERPCLLEVSDTGVGMTPEVQDRIFEPVFTTKEVGKGSGLGLFTVWGAVTQMGGTIEVKSAPNKGSRFILRFAAAAPEAERIQSMVDRRELAGHETVLLVEDEAQVRDVTALILKDLGYRVLEASNIDEAMNHAKSTRKIDLLVSDIVMPKASGPVVAARIKELIPTLRVLFISGYNKEMLSAYDASLGPTLPKPFTVEQLGKKVRELLDVEPAVAAAPHELVR